MVAIRKEVCWDILVGGGVNWPVIGTKPQGMDMASLQGSGESGVGGEFRGTFNSRGISN